MVQDHSVSTADGWTLSVRRIPAEGGPPRGLALLSHAMMVDRRSMDRPPGQGFASTLARHGWEVHLADLRGHGASGPSVKQGGSWTYDDLVLRDVPALMADARARAQGRPVVLVGHSLFGHVALATASSGAYTVPAPEAHVLFGVNTWLPGLDPSRWRDWKRRRDVLLVEALVAAFGRFPSRLLRLGPADEAAPYMGDIARFFLQGRWAARDGTDWYAGLASVRGPMLALVGRGDRLLAHPNAVRAWMKGLTGAEVDLRVLGAGDLGLSVDPGHMELVTDPGSRGVWDEVARWMAKATGAAAGERSW